MSWEDAGTKRRQEGIVPRECEPLCLKGHRRDIEWRGREEDGSRVGIGGGDGSGGGGAASGMESKSGGMAEGEGRWAELVGADQRREADGLVYGRDQSTCEV